MNMELRFWHGLATRRAFCGAALLTALFVVVPLRTFAAQPAAPAAESRVAEVPLADLDLSTAEGRRLARDRLHTMAERVCADRTGGIEASSAPAFKACVESTVATAARHIEVRKPTHLQLRNSVTVAEGVSLADLDLSTLQGTHIARQRLEKMARRVCDQLAQRPDVAFRMDYPACLHDTFSGALAQAEAIAAARNKRIAQRGAP